MNHTTGMPAYAPFPGLVPALGEVLLSDGFLLRCVISGAIACMLYVAAGLGVHHVYFRKVQRDVFQLSWNSDIILGLTSLVFGSPILQGFSVAHEKWGVMKVYTDMPTDLEGWAYWAASIPLYLLLWDLVFYVLHLVLHIEPIYSWSHANHHAFRPPVAWSGIAIDPVETIFSGLAPYLVPLFIAPFHLYTVYVVNVLLVVWATWLHSSAPWAGNWLMSCPVAHNLHHSAGKLNSNYGAIFKLWDRIFGTLAPEGKMPVWMVKEAEARVAAAAAASADGHSKGEGVSADGKAAEDAPQADGPTHRTTVRSRKAASRANFSSSSSSSSTSSTSSSTSDPSPRS